MDVKSAVLHMIVDAVASAGVIIGGLLMMLTGWYVIDPILSGLIAGLMSFGARQIVKQTVGVLMEGTPKGIYLQGVVGEIKGVRVCMLCMICTSGALQVGKTDYPATSCSMARCPFKTVKRFYVSWSIGWNTGIGHVTVQTEDALHPDADSELCATMEVCDCH